MVTTRDIVEGMHSTTWAIVIDPMQTVMTWGHIHLSWPSSLMPLLAHCFTSKQAATHSAWSPVSLEIKQQHVESDYTRGTLLCPPQSDDGDDRAWIFTAPDVNILACQRSTSPVPTPVHLHGSVKRWSCLYLATLTYLFPLFPLPPFHIWITEWTNCCLLENQWKWLIAVLVSVSS